VFPALPYVRQYDRPKNVIEGDPFQTECYAWGYPQVTVIWYHAVAEESRVLLKNGSVENSTLRIEDVRFDDSADYMCVATNALGSANATISLRVKGTAFVQSVMSFLCQCYYFANYKLHLVGEATAAQ